MENEPIPLYGELVIDTPYEKPVINQEIETMEEQTRLMIKEAAYYLAEKRGFAPGHELEDWLKAKTQIIKQFF